MGIFVAECIVLDTGHHGTGIPLACLRLGRLAHDRGLRCLWGCDEHAIAAACIRIHNHVGQWHRVGRLRRHSGARDEPTVR
jgi:hypothetical protein